MIETARVEVGDGVVLCALDVPGCVGIAWSDLTWPPKEIHETSVVVENEVLAPILRQFGVAARVHPEESPVQILRRVIAAIEGGAR